MTLIIENVKEEYLGAFKGLAEGVNATLRTQGIEECHLSHTPNEETLKALQECENGGNGEIVENFSAIDFHKQMQMELQNESRD